MKHEIAQYSEKYLRPLLNLFNDKEPRYFDKAERSDFKNYLRNERELCFVVLVDEIAIACGGINFSTQKKYTEIISWDIVNPNYHGLGIGKSLLLYRVQLLKQTEGIQKVVVRTSQHTYGFYQKMGFT